MTRTCLTHIYKEEGHSDLIQGLEIIPLSNNEWVSADMGPIHFSQETKHLKIPETVPIRTVSASIEHDLSRINLLLHLGVKPRLDVADVCFLIMKLHRQASFKPGSLTPAQLAEHIVFMFRASFHPSPGIDLWFATADNQRVKGSSLYMRAKCKPGSFEDRIRNHVETNYPLLHDAYVDAFQLDRLQEVTWTRWALRCFNIQLSTFPRICTGAAKRGRAGTLHLSDEFRSLFKTCSSSDVLELLRLRWRDYSQVIEEVYTINGKDLGNPVRDEIVAMSVRCYTNRGSKDACFRRLGDTFLPSLDKTVDQGSCIPLLDVSGPLKQWEFLKIFQVSVHRDIEYYFRCLLALKSSAIEPSKATVVHIYERIQGDYMDNKKVIW